VDDQETVWTTGDSCDDSQNTCPDQGEVFIASWPLGGAVADLAIVHGERSFGSAIAAGAGRIYVGGGYKGDLKIAGTDLDPSPDDVNPFVVAIDPIGRQTAWVYPTSGVPQIVPTGFGAVVDMAFNDACETPTLYVVGCIATEMSIVQGCTANRSFEKGRYGFVIALDADTGAERWRMDLVPTNPDVSLLVPTAIIPDGQGFTVALSFYGHTDLAGGIDSDDGVEALVLRYTP
jgi:hypothetical protein